MYVCEHVCLAAPHAYARVPTPYVYQMYCTQLRAHGSPLPQPSKYSHPERMLHQADIDIDAHHDWEIFYTMLMRVWECYDCDRYP
jgi:hypothetical protein